MLCPLGCNPVKNSSIIAAPAAGRITFTPYTEPLAGFLFVFVSKTRENHVRLGLGVLLLSFSCSLYIAPMMPGSF